jgi:mannose-6-phosphate isomerase-like protein (cupin superfamily)
MEKTIFEKILLDLESEGFVIESHDFNRPWGGFFVIEESQAQIFANRFFNGFSVDGLRIAGKLSPKILVVKPGARLSWQYHHRRAERWRVIEGNVAVMTSDTDTEGEIHSLHVGDEIILRQGERHRLIGLDDWGVVAEFWQHTEPHHPSDEEDIVRVQDDYGRGQ